jgi:hypothetical protein
MSTTRAAHGARTCQRCCDCVDRLTADRPATERHPYADQLAGVIDTALRSSWHVTFREQITVKRLAGRRAIDQLNRHNSRWLSNGSSPVVSGSMTISRMVRSHKKFTKKTLFVILHRPSHDVEIDALGPYSQRGELLRHSLTGSEGPPPPGMVAVLRRCLRACTLSGLAFAAS